MAFDRIEDNLSVNKIETKCFEYLRKLEQYAIDRRIKLVKSEEKHLQQLEEQLQDAYANLIEMQEGLEYLLVSNSEYEM